MIKVITPYFVDILVKEGGTVDEWLNALKIRFELKDDEKGKYVCEIIGNCLLIKQPNNKNFGNYIYEITSI